MLGAALAVFVPLANALRAGQPPQAVALIYYAFIAILFSSAAAGVGLAVWEERRSEWRCFFNAFTWPSLVVVLILGAQAVGGQK
jgi:hypothetical protein